VRETERPENYMFPRLSHCGSQSSTLVSHLYFSNFPWQKDGARFPISRDALNLDDHDDDHPLSLRSSGWSKTAPAIARPATITLAYVRGASREHEHEYIRLGSS